MISVIINHYRTPELLKLCVNSIKKVLKPGEYELMVRDGEALEETQELMREDFPDVQYFPEMENVGFAKLVNDGVRRAKGEQLLIINADVIIPNRAALDTLVAYLALNPTCGMVGPMLRNLNETLQPSCFRFYKPLTLLYRRTFFGKTPWGQRDISSFTYSDKLPTTNDLYDKRPLRQTTYDKSLVVSRKSLVIQPGPFPVDWLMGSALLVRRRAIEDVGLFDERFFMYFEDVDWCRRFWEKGWSVIYNPEAVFYHYHGQASRGKKGFFDVLLNKYTRIHITSAAKYFLKYGFRVPRYGI